MHTNSVLYISVSSVLQNTWVQRVLSPGVKWSGHETDYSQLFTAEDIIEWSYYIHCSIRLHNMKWNNFACILLSTLLSCIKY
jgi:hypothetical protein